MIARAKLEEFVATGKRKTAIARVRLRPGKGEFLINKKTLENYFGRATLPIIVKQPLTLVEKHEQMDVVATVLGGGIAAQAEALRHGISRALLLIDPELRKGLKDAGYLTRDPRAKERKKYGRKKARKSFQFSKR